MRIVEWVRRTLAKAWEVISRYPTRQANYLIGPARFAAALDLDSWETKKDAFSVLVLGGTLALLINKINVLLYSERVQRIIEVQDKTTNEILLLAVVAVFSLLVFIPFRLLGGRASLAGTLVVIMYAFAFTVPVATLLVILVTRAASGLLDADLVVIPPMKIVQLSYPDRTAFSDLIGGAYASVLVLWNVYFAWILWVALRTAHQIGHIRAVAAMAGGVALLFFLQEPINFAVNHFAKYAKPILDWVL